jgi:pyridoxine 5-phosphate synthase
VTLLSVNVDHIATLRQARGVDYPDPVVAARIAEDAGAAGITVHLRADQRHIQHHDVERLRPEVRGKLNLEMAATEAMLAAAFVLRPDQITLVPERPEEVTTEGGLDLLNHHRALGAAASSLSDEGLAVSLFVDPDLEQLARLESLSDGSIVGFEINTDAYTRAPHDDSEAELAKIVAAVEFGAEAGLSVYAGHGLTTDNVGPVAALEAVEELNIGHSIVSRAALIGMDAAVREMLDAMAVAGQHS